MQILLSRTQAGPGRTVKQEQEEMSPNPVQRLNLISVELQVTESLKKACSRLCVLALRGLRHSGLGFIATLRRMGILPHRVIAELLSEGDS